MRKSARERKLNLKYVSFFNDIRSKKLKIDLEKYVKFIETMFIKIFGFDVVINRDDI